MTAPALVLLAGVQPRASLEVHVLEVQPAAPLTHSLQLLFAGTFISLSGKGASVHLDAEDNHFKHSALRVGTACGPPSPENQELPCKKSQSSSSAEPFVLGDQGRANSATGQGRGLVPSGAQTAFGTVQPQGANPEKEGLFS